MVTEVEIYPPAADDAGCTAIISDGARSEYGQDWMQAYVLTASPVSGWMFKEIVFTASYVGIDLEGRYDEVRTNTYPPDIGVGGNTFTGNIGIITAEKFAEYYESYWAEQFPGQYKVGHQEITFVRAVFEQTAGTGKILYSPATGKIIYQDGGNILYDD